MEYYPFDDLAVNYTAGCEVGDDLYFSCNIFNGLFKYNKKTGEMTHLGIFEGSPFLAVNIHLKAFCMDGVILFVPFWARDLAVYNISDNSIDYIRINSGTLDSVVDAFIEGNKLWLFYSRKINSVVCVDLDDYSVHKYPTFNEWLLGKTKNNYEYAFYNAFSRNGKYAFGAVYGENLIVKVDLSSGDHEIIKLPSEDIKASGVVFSDEKLYISALSDAKIYRYDLKKKTIAVYREPEGYTCEREIYYPELACVAGRVLVFPQNGDRIYYSDDSDMTVKSFCIFPDGFDYSDYDNSTWKRFYFYRTDCNLVRLLPYSSNMILEVNAENIVCNGFNFAFDRMFIEELFKNTYKPKYIEAEKNNTILYESKMFGVEDFLSIL